MDQFRVGLGIFFGTLGLRMAVAAWSDYRQELERKANVSSLKKHDGDVLAQQDAIAAEERKQKLEELRRAEALRKEEHRVMMEKLKAKETIIKEVLSVATDSEKSINQKVDVVKKLNDL